jgi:hypothetical protein
MFFTIFADGENIGTLQFENKIQIVVYLTGLFGVHSCHKEPNLHTNELNTTIFLFDEPLKGSKPLKIFKISLTFRFDKFSNSDSVE